MKKLQVTIELIEEMLGTANSDPKIHEEFIASKAVSYTHQTLPTNREL